MRMVNCPTFKRRCPKSLSTVIRHADDAEMRFGILLEGLLGSLGPSYRRGVNMSKSKKSQKASTWRHWWILFIPQTALRPSKSEEVISMNPPRDAHLGAQNRFLQCFKALFFSFGPLGPPLWRPRIHNSLGFRLHARCRLQLCLLHAVQLLPLLDAYHLDKLPL